MANIVSVTPGTPGGSYTYGYDPAGDGMWAVNNQLAAGEETYPRLLGTSGQSLTSQQLRLTFFTARATGSTTGVRLYSGSVNSSGLTLARIGLYSVNATTGAGTLVASTASDTTLFNSATTKYTKSWSVAFTKVAGNRYALGVLVVGTTPGSVYAYTAPPDECAFAPRTGGALAAQADLPGSFTDAGLAISGFMPYAALT
jgi:hypothetical protein